MGNMMANIFFLTPIPGAEGIGQTGTQPGQSAVELERTP